MRILQQEFPDVHGRIECVESLVQNQVLRLTEVEVETITVVQSTDELQRQFAAFSHRFTICRMCRSFVSRTSLR